MMRDAVRPDLQREVIGACLVRMEEWIRLLEIASDRDRRLNRRTQMGSNGRLIDFARQG